MTVKNQIFAKKNAVWITMNMTKEDIRFNRCPGQITKSEKIPERKRPDQKKKIRVRSENVMKMYGV